MRSILTLFFAIAILVGCSFSKKKAYKYFIQAKQNAPYDVIIVPGVPHNGESWSSVMKIRVSWADYLYKNDITKNIIFSGGAVYTKYSEAKIMAEYGKALDIPSEHIFTDTIAEHSSENVYYSYLIAKENGFKRIALATDPFQAKSLRGMIQKLELPIDLIPIVYDTILKYKLAEPTISFESAIESPFTSIKDRESFFTRLKGTAGRHILFYEDDLPNQKTIDKFRKKGRLILE
ncbi:MAG TPA: YdcF family protein [Crocinitomicaceae bacterium]|nr:YdcF family protein [Crocinitomicaceae bacterium]